MSLSDLRSRHPPPNHGPPRPDSYAPMPMISYKPLSYKKMEIVVTLPGVDTEPRDDDIGRAESEMESASHAAHGGFQGRIG